MSNLEEAKNLLDSLDDAADAEDHGRYDDALQLLYVDGYLRWLVQQAKRVEELETKLSICESAVEGDQDVKERLSEDNQRGRMMKRYEMNIQGRELCERHGKLRCVECAYIAELEDRIAHMKGVGATNIEYMRELEWQNERYRQVIQKAVSCFNQDEHPEGMWELEQALKEDE